MERNADVFTILKNQRSKIPRELKSFDRGNIIGFIEKKITDARISKSSISRMTPSETPVPNTDSTNKLKITISLKGVALDRLFSFLYNIENAGIGLTTTSLSMDGASSKESNSWNVQLVVSCYLKRS